MNPAPISTVNKVAQSRTAPSRHIVAGWLCLVAAFAPSQTLDWQAESGAVWRTPWAVVDLDRNAEAQGPFLRFLTSHRDCRLEKPKIEEQTSTNLVLAYEITAPDQAKISLARKLCLQGPDAQSALVEVFELKPAALIRQDVEIVRPFTLRNLSAHAHLSPGAACLLPLKNGWAKTSPLSSEPIRSEYRLGHWIAGPETPELALPVVQLDRSNLWQAAVCADPTFGAHFSLTSHPQEIRGELRYRYAASQVPLGNIEIRRFGFWIRAAATPAEAFGPSLDAFFRLMLPDVSPGPAWLHEIRLVDYDFLSDNGQGWERDVQQLTTWLRPEERRHAALCLHGWYDALGSYSFDPAQDRLKDEWVAMARTRKVPFTPNELRLRLRLARDQGFRVLLYFADGLAADSGVPGYRPDWVYRDVKGNPITGWQGPDTFGPTYLMNPAHPELQQWFLRYLDALLSACGREVDGFVWDETFHARAGQVATQPAPAYCDRAMLGLVKALTKRVEQFDPQKVFLASDCVGIAPGIPGYALVADGLYQDTHCNPARWPEALFPNWRNTYWSCNWGPIGHFHWNRFAVEQYGAPMAISNGWGDDHGPSEWTTSERDAFLELFRQRLAKGPGQVRWLTQDPTELLAQLGPDSPAPSDSVPEAVAGEVNWALASQGARARASSEYILGDARHPADGAIDGSRTAGRWGAGHGWASASAAPLPQWLEVEFSQPRPIARFVVTTYQAGNDSARKWGVRDYRIETWDDPARQWRVVVEENRGRILATRVHALSRPVSTGKFRVIVSRVAPPDGIARLLQVEAWGKPEDEARPPNILLIISDDQAWTDYSFMGHPHIRTPHIDRLATEGLCFLRGYVPTSLCCPSLASIMTGRYPHEHKIANNDPPMPPGLRAQGYKSPQFRQGRERMNQFMDAQPTLPRLLVQDGYLALQTGKWWQGHYRRGGFTHGMTQGDEDQSGRHGDAGLKIGRETLLPIYDFIEMARQQNKPFFVWYAPMMPHDPHTPPARLLAHYRDQTNSIHVARYWAMVEWFDETCGQLIDYLDKHGLATNTIVAYVADNGWIQSPTDPRFAPKSKLSPYDGGLRTPILLRWPGHIQPGRSQALTSSLDLMPTLLHAAGIAPPAGLSGLDLLPASSAQPQRDAVFGAIYTHDAVDLDQPASSLRFRWTVVGDWKLIVPNPALETNTTVQLYHLARDPFETNDLAAAEPDRVTSLRQRLDAWWDPPQR